jgi:hypothetical protein
MNFPAPHVSTQSTTHRTLFGTVAVAAMLGVLAYLLVLSWPLLFPQPLFVTAAADGCDLYKGACTASFDNRRTIRFAIEPESLGPNRPLQIQIDTAGFQVSQVTIEFSGVDMDMGLIRNELSASGAGAFHGSAILPVCIRERMAWRAIVTAQGRDGVHKASFDFEVYRR